MHEAGAPFEVFTYRARAICSPTATADYDPVAAELMYGRVVELLSRRG